MDAEQADTWSEVDQLDEELTRLRAEIEIPFKYHACQSLVQVDSVRCSNEEHPCDFGLTLIGTCLNSGTICTSCEVEAATRVTLSLHCKVAVQQCQMKRLHTVMEKKSADLEESQ